MPTNVRAGSDPFEYVAARRRRSALGACFALGAACVASPARARADNRQGPYLSVGPLVTYGGWGNGTGESGVGLGGELTVGGFFNPVPPLFNRRPFYEPLGLGGFVQVQAAHLDHLRVAVGPQFTASVCGLELGLAWDTASAPFASMLSLQIAPFLSLLGVGSIAVEFSPVLATLDAGQRPGFAVTAAFTIKFPLVWEEGRVQTLWPLRR